MSRILVIGSGGTGNTTPARCIPTITHRPLVHLDCAVLSTRRVLGATRRSSDFVDERSALDRRDEGAVAISDLA
jgi:hypothetical protein